MIIGTDKQKAFIVKWVWISIRIMGFWRVWLNAVNYMLFCSGHGTENSTKAAWSATCGSCCTVIGRMGNVREIYEVAALRELTVCIKCPGHSTVETLYSTIYYSKYFIELNLDKSTQYVALWTHKRHSITRPFGRAMECLLWVFQQKLTVL